MDNWDQNIRKKAMQARPYKPKSDWARMEHLLDEATPPPRTKRWVWLLLAGCFFLAVGAGSWMYQEGHFSPAQEPHSVVQVDSPVSDHAKITPEQLADDMICPEDTMETSHFVSVENAREVSSSQTISMQETFVKDDAQRSDVQIIEVKGVDRKNVDHSPEPVPTFTPIKSPSAPQLFALENIQEQAFERVVLSHLSSPAVLPAADVPAHKIGGRWLVGLRYDQMFRTMPQPLNTPLALSQNPFAFSRQPGASLTLMREWGGRLSAGLRVGLDDAYYYADYQSVEQVVYDAQAPNTPRTQEALKSYIFVGTNYSLEAVGRWTFLDERKHKLRPYLEGSLGITQADGYFVELVGSAENYSSLGTLGRGFSKDVAKALGTGEALPVSRATSDFSDRLADFESDQFALTPGSDVLIEAVEQSDFVALSSPTYLSYGLAAGLNWKISSEWSMDAQASFLRRSSVSTIQLPTTEALEASESPNQAYPRNSLLPHVNYYRVSVGLTYRFR